MPETQNPETHHESSDVDIRALIWFAVIFVVFAIVMNLVLALQFKLYVKLERNRNKTPMTGIPRTPDMSVPKNQPLLQPFPRRTGTTVAPPYRVTPVSDLAEMRGAENRALHSYGWVDRQHGIVRMPIDVAMQMTLQRGLPVQSGAPAPSPAQTGAHP